jgi:TatD DNase family protein
VPYRGKTNQPSYVPLVAKMLGDLRGMSPEAMGQLTSDNFDRLFQKVHV